MLFEELKNNWFPIGNVHITKNAFVLTISDFIFWNSAVDEIWGRHDSVPVFGGRH